jgi:cytochrome c oxidase subunit II
MFNNFPLFPQEASSYARDVDALYLFLVAVSGVMTLLIAVMIVYLSVRYRHRQGNEIASKEEAPKALEAIWIAIPFVVFMVIFVWGARVYFKLYRVPENGVEVYATAKQWMWRFQHSGGQSEINELHIPVGRPVIVTMISEDVIHSFYVPAFRLKLDVLPNRMRKGWFMATKPGRYHLFCAEYCGTNHSGMIGWVTVMELADYQQWLNGGGAEGSPATEGRKLFEKLACVTCHTNTAGARGPSLIGLYGSTARLRGGETVVADENYIRESVVTPQAKIVEGFEPIMPSFQGQVSEPQILQLIAFIKSLTPQTNAPQANAGAPSTSTAASEDTRTTGKNQP